MIKRLLLKIIFGNKTYNYICRCLAQDPRLIRASTVDIVVRKDGLERRIEADWIKKLAKILGKDVTDKKPVPQY